MLKGCLNTSKFEMTLNQKPQPAPWHQWVDDADVKHGTLATLCPCYQKMDRGFKFLI